MKTIGDYFQENELIINVNKGKTEVMLFGSSKRLKRQGKSLQISYRETPINTVTKYKYLGTVVDSQLLFNDNFNKAYRRASSRLRLLQRLRSFLSCDVALKLFLMIILPLITYSSSRKPFNETQQNKLSSLDNRARTIVQPKKQIPSIINQVKRERCREKVLVERI